MKTGTKSLLIGVHNIIWHPITVYLAWIKLYGKRPSFKETICIIIHDWGYWGCEYMDDEKGQDHPRWAARIIYYLFKDESLSRFCFLHSRHLAKKWGYEPSKLCWADKLSIIYDPCWFYLFRARLSGEIKEYRAENEACGFCPAGETNVEWFKRIVAYMSEQAYAQKSGNYFMKTEKGAAHER